MLVGLMTDLLREGVKKEKFAYSFSRFQLWLWTMIVAATFCLHWGWHSTEGPYLNSTGLILLGISAGTTITSTTIKFVQLNAPKPLGSEVRPHKAKDPRTIGLLTDILTDDAGQLSLVRLQNLVFRLVYIGIYVSMFFSNMEYPEFDETAYTLMGISSGSYLLGRALNK